MRTTLGCCILFSPNLGSNILQNRASHLTNHESKISQTCLTLLGKEEWTHQLSSLLDACTWTQHCWPTNKNLHYQFYVDSGYLLEDLTRALTDRQMVTERTEGIYAVWKTLLMMMKKIKFNTNLKRWLSSKRHLSPMNWYLVGESC